MLRTGGSPSGKGGEKAPQEIQGCGSSTSVCNSQDLAVVLTADVKCHHSIFTEGTLPRKQTSSGEVPVAALSVSGVESGFALSSSL